MKYDDGKNRNVAIYARVSTEHEAQMYALDNQIDWYNDILDRHPTWTLIEKYIDRGITGTSAKKRPAFMKMIEDAENGDFDLIITREVSRFARNTVDTLQYTRRLKKYDVEVYFVEDNIFTYDPDGELRLTIMATLAQDESRKISLRCKAGQRTSMEKGVFFQNGSVLGYDYNKVTRELTINPEQAETVKMIFDLYNSGLGVRKIQWELEKAGRKTAKGSTLWSASVIGRTLRNKLYAGYLVWYKQYVPDFLEQKKINNPGVENGGKEQFEVLGSHEPIVTLEEWESAQARLNARKTNNGSQKTVRESLDVWGRKLRCSCGSKFQRKQEHKNSDNGKMYYRYMCYSQIKSGTIRSRKNKGLPIEGMCATPSVTQWKLEAMAYYIFRMLTVRKKEIIVRASEMIDMLAESSDNILAIEESKRLKSCIDRYNRKIDNLIDLRTDGEISKEQYIDKKIEYEKQLQHLQDQLDELSGADERIEEMTSKLDLFKACLDRIELLENTKKVPEYLIEAAVDYIIVDGNTFKWKMKLLPDGFDLDCDLKVEGSRESNYSIEVIGGNIPQFANGSTGSHKQQAELKNALKIAEWGFTKEVMKTCIEYNPRDRFHMWRDSVIELYI